MAANYYGFGAGTGNQHFSMGPPGSFNNPSYGVQHPPAGQPYISPAGPPVPQQTYMAYGHVRHQGNSSAPTQYQNNFSYGSGGQPAQQQPQQFFQAGNSSSAGWGSSSNMNVKTPQQPQQSRPTMYTNNASSNYNQPVGNVVQQTPTTSNNSNKGSFGQPQQQQQQQQQPPQQQQQPHPPGRPQNMSNYEKALISAANSIYQQQHKGGGGGGGGGGGNNANAQNLKNMPYWKQKRIQAQQNRDPNKPIIASEVKAYLYAWLGKERTRPEYNITAHGSSPYRQSYVCEVMVPGYQYVGKGTAGNKKDSQTRAAWDFCDYLVRENKMKESELPTRESKFKPSSNQLPPGYKSRPDSEIIASLTKKKVATNKISFVGGSTLHLSSNQTEIKQEIGPVAYPTSATQPTTQVATVKVEVTPQTSNKVHLVQLAEKPVESTPVNVQRDGGEAAALKNDPIGEEYVEQVWTDGRVIRFRCKLCECEFNDPSARELHVRGRRHKLSYKKKVDPSIEVDVKLNPKQKSLMMIKMKQEARKEAMRNQRKQHMQWKMEMQKIEEEEMRSYEEEMYYQYQDEMVAFEEQVEFHRRRGIPMPQHLAPPIPPPLRFFRPMSMTQSQQMKSLDDQHVINKHNQIYPTEEELSNVQTAVQTIETALKNVSTVIHEQEMKVFTASNPTGKKPQPERLLKAVLRIGALAKGLLLRGNLNAELVLMCNQKPTRGLLSRVVDHLPKHLANKETKFSLILCPDECGLLLTTLSQPTVTIRIILTATQMRTIEDGAGTAMSEVKPDPPDLLDRGKCCRALAALRHAKWFQAKANGLQSCVLVTRVMKDLCVRVPTWSPLTSWAVELLVERVISSATLPLSPSAALQRVFEALASGVLLPGGPGLMDPCERKPTDAAEGLTSQEREDITASAQHALRLLSFRNIHKVLGMEPILANNNRQPPKRTQDESAEQKGLNKKVKVEKSD